MPNRRSRRRTHPLVAGGALVAGLAVAVGGVVIALQYLEPTTPLIQQCVVGADGERVGLEPEQTGHAALLAGVAAERGLPARAITIALATAMQESRLLNIDYGDRDSLGLFQQRPSQGWGSPAEIMDPVYSTNTFYDALVEVPGYQDMEITVAAQTVQRSAFPDAYAQHEGLARLFASALAGHSPATLTCHLEPADAAEMAQMPGALAAHLQRDLPSVTARSASASGGGATNADMLLNPAALNTDGTAETGVRLSWALAHWAVATAWSTGVSEVLVDGYQWSRADGAQSQWQPLESDSDADRVPEGQVLVR